jgi:hypothetical protein
LLVAQLRERAHPRSGTRIVDQDVEAAERLDRGANRRVDLPDVGDVKGHRDGLAARVLYSTACLLEPVKNLLPTPSSPAENGATLEPWHGAPGKSPNSPAPA